MLSPNFKVKENKLTKDYGEFIIEPLEPGYGHTLGNSLRRVLLISIPGAAVTSVKISGVKHKFSTIAGVKENAVDLLLNIKGLNFKLLDSKTSSTVRLSVKGPKEVTGKDLELPEDVELVNKDHYIAHLDKKGKLDMELTIESGYGYSLSEERKISTLGVLPTDAIFTPVRRVNYEVSATRVGRQTNLDRLTLKVWTNGVVEPRQALDEAAKVIASYFFQLYEPKAMEKETEEAGSASGYSDAITRMTIDELDLPTRIYNSLRNGGIETIGQLLETPRKELVSMRNMGGKSISVIEEKLKEKGITLSV